MFELIQYTPTTSRSARRPLLLVPPTINKFYALDLAPGRSLVEYLARVGAAGVRDVLAQPGCRHADWGLDTYVEAVLDALDAVERRSARPSRRCSPASARAASSRRWRRPTSPRTGRQDRLAGLTLAVTVLDQSDAGLAGSHDGPTAARRRRWRCRRRRATSTAGRWPRCSPGCGPSDLIWNYWVNNYLLGQEAAGVRHPVLERRHHPDAGRSCTPTSSRSRMDNKLVTAGGGDGARACRSTCPRSPSTPTSSAGIADHITPWQNCYRTTQLLGGTTRFVLSTSGHIAALVNPPRNPKAELPDSQGQPRRPAGLAEHRRDPAGQLVARLRGLAGRALGGAQAGARAARRRGRFAPLADAPGTYVFDK